LRRYHAHGHGELDIPSTSTPQRFSTVAGGGGSSSPAAACVEQ
jgi:hypothetical protein